MIKTIFIFLALFLLALVFYEENSDKMKAAPLVDSKSNRSATNLNSKSSSKKGKQDSNSEPILAEESLRKARKNSYVNSGKTKANSKNSTTKNKIQATSNPMLVSKESKNNTGSFTELTATSAIMAKEDAKGSITVAKVNSNNNEPDNNKHNTQETNKLVSTNELLVTNEEPAYFSNLQWELFFGTHYTYYDATFDVPVDSDRFFVEHPNITFGFNVYKPAKYFDYGFGLSLSSNSLVNYYTGLSAIIYPNIAETSIAYFPIASLYLTFKKELTYKDNTFVFRTKFGFVSSYSADRSYNDYIHYDLPFFPPVATSVVTNEGIDLTGKWFASFAVGYEITDSLELSPYINFSSYIIDAEIDTCLPFPSGECPKLHKTTVADTLAKEIGLMLIYKF